jgi:succinate-acetate transporter protein
MSGSVIVPDTVPHDLLEAPPPEAPAADPALVGLPAFLVGSIALGLVLVGFVPAAAAGASLPIIATATAVGLTIAAVWAARLAQSAVAGVFGVFAGFWASYAALVLGLTHDWFGVGAANVARVQELFLITWLAMIVLLTITSLRLPIAYTVLFAVVDIALLLVLLGTVNASTSLTKAGGYAVFAFVLVGAYLFVNSMLTATGGRALPVGRPLLH